MYEVFVYYFNSIYWPRNEFIAAQQKEFVHIFFILLKSDAMSTPESTVFSDIPWLKIFNQTIDQPQALPAVLAGFGVDAFRLAAITKESSTPGEAYGRKVLFKNEDVEVMLAKWSYKKTAAPHNHGTSQGLIWFAQGNFLEQHYRFLNQNLVHNEAAQIYKENQVVTVDTKDIHSCCPETTGISLHIYSPPIHDMKVWDQEHKRTLTVADECGAWVPQNKNLIVSEIKW